MKEQSKIPTSKVQRAAKFVKTGAKVGGNYVKHYAKKAVNPSLSKDELHADLLKYRSSVQKTLSIQLMPYL